MNKFLKTGVVLLPFFLIFGAISMADDDENFEKVRGVPHREGELLVAPFSGKKCVYYEVEAYFETSGEAYHIGTRLSDDHFAIKVKNQIIPVDQVDLDFSETFRRKEKTAQLSPRIREGLKELQWLDTALSRPSVTVYEKILLPDTSYTVRIEK